MKDVIRRKKTNIFVDPYYVTDWNKETILFLIKNRELIRSWILQSLNKVRSKKLLGSVKAYEVDDIFQTTLVYFSNKADYRADLAPTIEHYLRIIIKKICINYNYRMVKEYNLTIKSNKDTVASSAEDEAFKENQDIIDIELNISKMLKSIAYKRNVYRVSDKFDLFDLLYIIILYRRRDGSAEIFRWMIKKELAFKMKDDPEVMNVLRVLSQYKNIDEVLDEIESWSYRVPVLRKIREVIVVQDEKEAEESENELAEKDDFESISF